MNASGFRLLAVILLPFPVSQSKRRIPITSSVITASVSLDTEVLPGSLAPQVRLAALALLLVALAEAASGQTWKPTSAPRLKWDQIVSSADGTKIAALGAGGLSTSPNYCVFTSTDRGATWRSNSLPKLNWSSLANSADGTRLMALASTVNWQASPLYSSTNWGGDWTVMNAPSTNWTVLGSSADGTTLVAGASAGGIYSSTNFGKSWVLTSAPPGYWWILALSADASTIIVVSFAADAGPPVSVISTNGGATWDTGRLPLTGFPTGLACSADGSQVVLGTVRGVHTSTNSGHSFTQTGLSGRYWRVGCSVDGSRLVAAASWTTSSNATALIYTSTDAGRSWAASDAPSALWNAVASSADGYKLLAGVGDAYTPGSIYASQSTPSPLLHATSPTNNLLSWIVPSMDFVLQQSATLLPGEWKSVGVAPVLNYSNLQYQISVPRPDGAMFYRLVSQ